MKKYKIFTLGCKVNTYESQVMKELLEKDGYVSASEEDLDVDVAIVNTCAVTSMAGQKSRKLLHKVRHEYLQAILVAVGCYVQLDGRNLDDVDIAIGTNDKNKIVEKIHEYLKNQEKIILIDNSRDRKEYECVSVSSYSENTRSFVKIQDGCDNFCSYCIVPFTRGKFRSRKKDEILNEIHDLINNGYQEIVLTGIDTAGYGKDINESFVELLKDILKQEPNLKRLRISSIEASQISDEFIELLSNEDRIAPHLHIPLQSGSNTVLHRMNRKYTVEEFYQRIQKIKQAKKNIALACDVIVGFPEETEEEFEESKNFIIKCEFDYLHVFPYSIRPGTRASKMKQVPSEIKKNRCKNLINLGDKLQKAYYDEFDNKILEVLFESKSKNGNIWSGYTSNYIYVSVNSEQNLHNKILKVKFNSHGLSTLID